MIPTPPRRLIGVALPSVVLLVLATGCGALNAKRPTASLRSANVDQVTAEGLTVNFDVGVQNPNAFAVPLTQADYRLALGGVRVVDDQARPDAAIPANGSGAVNLPVRLDFASLLKAKNALARSGGNIPYAFDGGLEFSAGQSPLGQGLRVPLQFEGTLNLRDALQQAMRNPSILANPNAREVLGALFSNPGGLGDFLRGLNP